MEVVCFSSDHIESSILCDIFEFCKLAEVESIKNAAENMAVSNWENNTASLMYILLRTDRFVSTNGMFSCLYDDNKLVAVSGCYKFEVNRDIVIGGVRAWVLPTYRAKYLQANYLLKTQQQWAIEHNAKVFALTFNDYNFKLMQIITRSGKYNSKAEKGVGHSRPDFYKNFTMLPNKILIKNVPQWVIYQQLDLDYKIMWPDT